MYISKQVYVHIYDSEFVLASSCDDRCEKNGDQDESEDPEKRERQLVSERKAKDLRHIIAPKVHPKENLRKSRESLVLKMKEKLEQERGEKARSIVPTTRRRQKEQWP